MAERLSVFPLSLVFSLHCHPQATFPESTLNGWSRRLEGSSDICEGSGPLRIKEVRAERPLGIITHSFLL
jgi:hypothetical protein